MPERDDVAARAFAAWRRGEAGPDAEAGGEGGYDAFRALLAPPERFGRFSHPVSPRGVYDGAEGHARLSELVAARVATPNALTFSSVARLDSADDGGADGHTAVFFFDSEGTVSGGFPYRGHNAIALTVRDGRVTGFREYFGDIDPAWFASGGGDSGGS